MKISFSRFADSGGLRLRTTTVTVATTLLGVAAALVLGRAAGQTVDLVVLAVMLSIGFTRARAGHTLRQRAVSAVALPLVGLGAGAVGALMSHQPVLGDALYVLAASGAIWLRRFGPLATRVGTLIALPFVGVLVVPLPVRPSGAFGVWAAVVAVAVVVFGALMDALARRTGLLTATEPAEAHRPSSRRAAGSRAPGEAAARNVAAPSARKASRGLPASTRMAVQMAAALTAAFLVGHLAFGEHWPWLVLTAYIVSSGNRGRGDVFYKGVQRVVGALLGTAVGTVLSVVGHPGDPALLVALAVVLALALWLRPVGYGWWAAGVTAALALLYDFSGVTGEHALLERLVAIVVGGIIASLAAGFVLPVPTVDVVRRRAADALAALSGVLREALTLGKEADEQDHDVESLQDSEREYRAAAARLEQLAPALRAHRAALRRGRVGEHPAALLELIGQSELPVRRFVESVVADGGLAGLPRARAGALARRVGHARRVLGGADPAEGESTAEGVADAASDGLGEVATLIERMLPELAAIRRP